MRGILILLPFISGCLFLRISAISLEEMLLPAEENPLARSTPLFLSLRQRKRPFRFMTTLEQSNEIPDRAFSPIRKPFTATKDLPPMLLEQLIVAALTTSTLAPTTTTPAAATIGFPVATNNKMEKPFKRIKAPFNAMKGLPPSFFELLLKEATTTTTTTTTTPTTTSSTTTSTTTTTTTTTTTPTTTTSTTTPTTTTTTPTTTTTTTTTTTPTTTSSTTPSTVPATMPPTTPTTTPTTPPPTMPPTLPSTEPPTTTPTTTSTTTTTTTTTTEAARTQAMKFATARTCTPDVLAANWHGIVPIGQCVTLDEIDNVCQKLFTEMFEAAASSSCPIASWCCYRPPINLVL